MKNVTLRQLRVFEAVATTTTPINVSTLLRSRLGVAALDWFEVIAAGDVVAAKKPAADIYTYCLAQLGLPASACLAIEDSASGLAASHAAGIATVVTPSEYTQGQDFGTARAVLPDLSGLALAQLDHLMARPQGAALFA